MKKLIVMGIVCAMVMGLAGAASAAFTADDTIKIYMKLENSLGTSNGNLICGTIAGAANGFVYGEDVQQGGVVTGAGEINCTDLGAQTGVSDGRYGTDYRAPMTAAGQIQVWNLSAYLNGTASGTATLKAWASSTGKIDSVDYFGYLYEGVVTAQNYKSATPVWTVPIGANGTSTNPQKTITGISLTGSKAYTLVLGTTPLAPVPEPGSMLAMLSGLVGLVGFGIRRRK